MRKKTTEEFIRDAQSLWGIGEFDYSQVDYNGNKVPVTITCKNGHTFTQTPHDHLSGYGCMQCYRNSRKKTIFGVGINDAWNVQKDPAYVTWRNMLTRCYDEDSRCKFPTYIDVTVCEDWLTFSNFKKWFDENYIEGYHMDKDILSKGSKIYSPETCCFVPQEINALFISSQSKRGKYPRGVHKSGKRYISQCPPLGYVGSFDNPEAAFLAYKKAKEQYVKELAEKYYKEGKITERVYLALLDYRVEITD